MPALNKLLVVHSMTPHLRQHQKLALIFTWVLGLYFLGMAAENWRSEEWAPHFTVGMLFLIVACIQCLFLVGYHISFHIDGEKRQIVRVRQFFGWTWLRVFPADQFELVEMYSMTGSPIAGGYLQLLGKGIRLRLVYCPSGQGLREQGEQIASILGMDFKHDEVVESQRTATWLEKQPVWLVVLTALGTILGLGCLGVFILNRLLA